MTIDKITTPTFRGSYVNVFEPRKNNLSGKMEYSLDALFAPGQDLSELHALVEAAKIERWGSDKKLHPKNIRSPFKNQGEVIDKNTGETRDGYVDGALYLKLKSEKPIEVVDHNVQKILNQSEVYGGAYYKAVVNAYAYPKKGQAGITPGVALGLRSLQKVRDGDQFGSGSTNAEDFFKPVAEVEGDSWNLENLV
jgi:hypothetical protein